MSEINKVMNDAAVFARKNVRQGAIELREWGETGLLRDGVVRELVRTLEPHVGGHQAHTVAETLFRNACIDVVAGDGETFVLVQIENHPDRCVEDVHGPFYDHDAAYAESEAREKLPANFNHSHRLFDYRVFRVF